jgi:hypothetical protein
MHTAQGTFPMETTQEWSAAGDTATRITLLNRGEPSGFAGVAAAHVGRHAPRQPEGRRPPVVRPRVPVNTFPWSAAAASAALPTPADLTITDHQVPTGDDAQITVRWPRP